MTTTLRRSWLVGQNAEVCAIHVDDPFASGVHCQIDETEALRSTAKPRFLVRDLGSTNGTWVRDAAGVKRRVYGPQLIEAGETLIVGRSELLWQPGNAFIFNRAEPQPSACCEFHNRNCEPPSELCCEQCSEATHGLGFDLRSHGDGSLCIAPDLSGNGTLAT